MSLSQACNQKYYSQHNQSVSSDNMGLRFPFSNRSRPIDIGALGVISKWFSRFLKDLQLQKPNPYILQKTAILGTAAMLCRDLQLSDLG